MVKTQVQIPDALFQRAKRVAAQKEWSFAEIVRRGLEYMTQRQPQAEKEEERTWRLPDAVDLGLRSDPFADPNWREDAALGSGAARLLAERLREQADRYAAGT
ncbi:MAG TPA: hypothetical protein PKM73_04900 [Verrucomicrobiota bacterium]|nr:hypothetical protein [Verrucomicrobiota bacterium]HNU50700.1 hypothetical protein [Verrucomicrobiota bacterium]